MNGLESLRVTFRDQGGLCSSRRYHRAISRRWQRGWVNLFGRILGIGAFRRLLVFGRTGFVRRAGLFARPVGLGDDELDDEGDESDGLSLAEASDLNTNGHARNDEASMSPALGEVDAEGRDETAKPADDEGSE